MPLYSVRYPRIHDFDVYFSLRVSEQTYCGDYETVVLDEIGDLMGSDGKDVEIILDKSKKKVTLYTARKRKLIARLVRMRLCSPPAIARSGHP
jgi:hypothetical protein